jgi:hypothetical protein
MPINELAYFTYFAFMGMALGAHQRIAGFVARESMLRGALGTHENVFFSPNVAGTTLAAKFFLRF